MSVFSFGGVIPYNKIPASLFKILSFNIKIIFTNVVRTLEIKEYQTDNYMSESLIFPK
jgi:hypothetical protein